MMLQAKSHEGFFPQGSSISNEAFDVHSKHFSKVWLGDVVFDDVFDIEKQNESKLQEWVSCWYLWYAQVNVASELDSILIHLIDLQCFSVI